MKKINWKRFLPLLDITIHIPFISIHTEIFCKRVYQDTFEYVVLAGMIYKWKIRFRLYKRLYHP